MYEAELAGVIFVCEEALDSGRGTRRCRFEGGMASSILGETMLCDRVVAVVVGDGQAVAELARRSVRMKGTASLI